MLKLFSAKALLVTGLLVFATTCFAAEKNDNVKAVNLVSSISDQTLTFDVILPKGYNDNSEIRYPVLFTTAGGSRKTVLTEQINWLSHVDFGPMPKVITVLMPFIKLEDNQTKFAASSGSLDLITAQVLEKELIPYIDKHFRTHPYRMMEGFSTSGNFPLYVFANHPELINAYFVSSPALAQDKSGLVSSFDSTSPTNAHKNRSLYLNLGSFTENKVPFKQLKAALSKWKAANTEGLSMELLDYSAMNYLSAPVILFDTAVQQLFSDRAPELSLFKQSGVSGVKRYFEQLKNKYHFEMDDTSILIDLSHYFANNKMHKQAMETIHSVVTSDSNNIFLLTRLAAIEGKTGNKKAAKQTLNKALNFALKEKNEDATSYIRYQLTQLK